MTNLPGPYIFGEVLFDCFQTGEQILGGAPFNVAWHLQALGHAPLLISRVGHDIQGNKVLGAMAKCGMDTRAVQVDTTYPTGQVQVTIHNNEPHYNIVSNSAFDFISAEQLPQTQAHGIFYHGTLCLRNPISHNAYQRFSQNKDLPIFVDINLRSPWWHRDEVFTCLNKAHWAKMNSEELQLLDKTADDIQQQMAKLQTRCGLEQLIVTRGDQGALIRTATGDFHSLRPDKVEDMLDSVGAGDAFSAVYIHGLLAGWPIDKNLHHAQQFASKILELRGATTDSPNFYRDFLTSISMKPA